MENKDLKKAEVKLSEQEFNSCPGRAEIIRMLEKRTAGLYRVVDVLGKGYWENDEATLVIAIKEDRGEKIASAYEVCESADEKDHIRERSGKEIIMRFWWD